LNGDWIRTKVSITNRLGLHARPAMVMVDTANEFKSEIRIVKDGLQVDGKSIMHIMMLAAAKDTNLTIEARGADAQQALDALADLVNRRFDEPD